MARLKPCPFKAAPFVWRDGPWHQPGLKPQLKRESEMARLKPCRFDYAGLWAAWTVRIQAMSSGLTGFCCLASAGQFSLSA